jgi:3-hydroxyisobutyrate dehydrogenase-like beta-hydroxyacid dehydrogenase
MKIAFLGLGNMGVPMAQSLLNAGHKLTVWNRTLSKAGPLRQYGASVANSPAEAVGSAEIAVTMLADDNAVETALFGQDGLLQALPPGAVHVSSSTISVALSQRLAQEHAQHGQQYIAAPVFGRPEAAQAGKLFVVAAGNAATIERCRPVLEGVGQRLFVIGDRLHWGG